MGLLPCFLSGDHGRVGLSNAADIKSFKWTFAKLTHTVIDESIVYRIWTLGFSQLKKSIQGHVCNVHGYLYALLSCDIVSILGDLKFAPPSEESKSCHVVLMIFITNSNFNRNPNSYSPHWRGKVAYIPTEPSLTFSRKGTFLVGGCDKLHHEFRAENLRAFKYQDTTGGGHSFMVNERELL
jgi:hypothetical protein